MATVYLLPGRDKRVHAGHPWVFQSDIKGATDDCAPGGVVTVAASNGRFLARALYNPKSQIALRIVTRNDEPVDGAFIRARVLRAIDYRRAFADMRSCRLIYSESDGLPGLAVDSFGDVLSLQCLSLGMEAFKQTVVDTLAEALSPRGIYERDDVPVRALEGMEQKTGVLLGDVPERVEIAENGVRFLVDVKSGQKTGYFLDQKENRAAIAPFVKDARVLDCFTHTGAFALHAAKFGAREVTGVDISEFACQCARENAALNGFTNAQFKAANVFDLLKEETLSGKQYDMVILDPPAFAKTRAAREAAARGYKEINLRAIKLIRDGGYLVTCSCSQHVRPDMFLQIVADAAADARATLMQIEYRTQGRDHPILPAAPETQYLKCGIFRVDR